MDTKKIEALVEEGYIYSKRLDDLTLYNYTNKTQFDGHWNEYTMMCRGLIVRDDGEIVARPFDKFFNWGERGRKASGHIVNTTSKLDGSLGILYRHNLNYKIATRGAFDSPQALWATQFLNEWWADLDIPEHLTLIFEIIYPDNRIVVDYGDTENIYLLAARNRHTGEYLPHYPDLEEFASSHLFDMPSSVSFNRVEDILSASEVLDGNSEGWVVEFSDGQRFKFKGDRYLELHKLLYTTSFKRVVNAVRYFMIDSLLYGVPDELLGQINEWKEEIEEHYYDVNHQVLVAYDDVPKNLSRKEYASYVKSKYNNLAPYLFALRDGKDVRDLIFKIEFR